MIYNGYTYSWMDLHIITEGDLSGVIWYKQTMIKQYWLVVYLPLLNNMKVSWDYEIPNWMENMFQTTNQITTIIYQNLSLISHYIPMNVTI